MGWYHEDWEFRKEISIDHTKVDADLSGFPVLILRADTDLRDKARTDGRDILFTTSDGETKIAHEVERYTSSSGELIAHVRVPAVSSSVDTKIYICYGNPDAPTQQDPAAVWDEDYIAVYHMDEPDLATREDATQYNNHATNHSVYRQPGKVGYASWFNGFTSYLRVPDSASIRSINDVFTCEIWVNHEEIRVDYGYCRTPGEYAQGFVVDRHDHRLRVVIFEGGVGQEASRSWYPATDAWYSVGGRYNHSRISAILGGSEYQGFNYPGSLSPSLNGWVLGAVFTDGKINMFGMIDELRVSRVARSMPWIRAGYRNQNAPHTFHVFGPEEVRAVLREETVTSHLSTMASEAVRTLAVGTVRVRSYVGRTASRAFRPDVVDRFVTSYVRRITFQNQIAETFRYAEDDEADFATGSLVNVKAVTLKDPVTGALVLESTETRDPPSESVNVEDYCSFEATLVPEDEWIAAVHIENQDGRVLLDSQTPNPSPTGYRDGTELIVDCSPGDVLTISVTVDAEDTTWVESLSWGHTIYTQDLVTVEDLYESDGCPWTHTYQWTVPDEPGNFLMSWWVHYDGFDEPCGDTDFGERQDFTLNIAEVAVVYEESGERVSPAVDISEVAYVEASRVLFDLNLPAGTDGMIELSTDGTTYETVASGDPVPFVAKGEGNEHDAFYLRQTLSTTDTDSTPELRYFELWITYKPVKVEDRRVPSHVRGIRMTADRAGVMQAWVASHLSPLNVKARLSRAAIKVGSQVVRIIAVTSRLAVATKTVVSRFKRLLSRSRRVATMQANATSVVSRISATVGVMGAGLRAIGSHLRKIRTRVRTKELLLHFDATNIKNLADGDRVSVWEDISGYDRNAEQAQANHQPTYKTEDVVINGLPVVTFQRAENEYLVTPYTPNEDDLGQGGAVFAVVRATVLAENMNIAGSWGEPRFYVRNRAPDEALQIGYGDDWAFGGVFPVDEPVIVTMLFDGSTATGYINGALQVDTLAEFIGTNVNNVGIGRAVGIDDDWDGEIGEVLVYAKITDEARQEVEQYLYQKWFVVPEVRTVNSYVSRLMSRAQRWVSTVRNIHLYVGRVASRARRFIIHEIAVTSVVSRFMGVAERIGAGIRTPASFLRRVLRFARRMGSGERTVESILLRKLSAARRTASGTRTIDSSMGSITFRAFRIPAVERRVTSLWGRLIFTSDRSGRGERSETSFVSRMASQARGTAQVLRPVKSVVRRVMSRADAFFGVLVTVRSHLRRMTGRAWAEVELHVLVKSVVRRVRFRVVGTGITHRISSHLRSVTSRAQRVGTVFRPVRLFISGIPWRVRTAALKIAAVKSYVRRIAGSARTDVIEVIKVTSHLGRVILDTRRVALRVESVTSRVRHIVSRASRTGSGIRGVSFILRPLIFLTRRRGEGIRRITSPAARLLYPVRRAGSGIRPIHSVLGFIQWKVEVSVSRRVRSFLTRIAVDLERASRGKRAAPSVVRRFIFRPITLLAVFIFSPCTAVVEKSRTEAKGAMSFDMKQNDTWPPLRAQLVQADREPIPLAGATVHFVMKNGAGEVVIDRAAEIIDEEEGRVEFTFQEGETATAGDFYGEFKVVYPGIPPETVTVPNYKFIRVNIEKELREQVNA